MRSGRLDSVIDITRIMEVDDGRGNVSFEEVSTATLRAQIMQTSTEEFIRAWGASSETLTIFRTRYVDGVELSDRVKHDGQTYDLKEIKPIGRRRGLELRCVAR